MTGNILIWRGEKSLGRIDFCWKEIILLKFQKNFFWQEKFYSGKNSFCFERKKFCWQEISMLNSWREIFLSEVLILEGIYSAQEFNFFWQEINVLRSLKDFCRPILLFWKEFIFCWKNWFLLETRLRSKVFSLDNMSGNDIWEPNSCPVRISESQNRKRFCNKKVGS